MHEYDITLKRVLRRLTGSVLRELTGFTVRRWHNAELPEVHSRRADMLGETAGGDLVHIELQSTNQSGMALRMLEYTTAIYGQFGRFPHQVVLYVGAAPLRMPGRLAGPSLEFSCRMVDIRQLDSQPLLESSRVEDNVIAVLARLNDERHAVKRILRSVAACEPSQRSVALAELLYLAGLRKLAPVIRQEAERMPILNDIMDHAVIGPERRRGKEEGERRIVLTMASKRFGPLSATARKRIEALPASKLERVALRLLDAKSLDQLLK